MRPTAAESGLNLIAERKGERGRAGREESALIFRRIPAKGEAVYLAWQIGFGWGCQRTHGESQDSLCLRYHYHAWTHIARTATISQFSLLALLELKHANSSTTPCAPGEPQKLKR